ncbi:response regulator transcription factor [Rhizobium sp. NFR03]|uniref:response regulator n=1 Tax=Rhizobium sp. NFR03 TaxID=1566263 RepID=UPI0008CA71C2|nr:response regulator transcription factor [Rhizobium sp. NFR03]SES47395.1 two component transcriptional regulator, LuxR family [Rhizobium sp. NFR03]
MSDVAGKAEVLRVAIVDDHPMFRMGVVRGLEDEAGLEIVGEGASAADAVSLFRTHRPDINLLDLSMPGGGHAAIRAIRQIDPNALIVVLTASASDADVRDALSAGASGYVLKGVEVEELHQVLRCVASGKTCIPESLVLRLPGRPPVNGLATGAGHSDVAAIPALTPREEQILLLVSEGHSNKEVGRLLALQEKSIKHVMTRILRKLRVRNRTEAAMVLRDWQQRAKL